MPCSAACPWPRSSGCSNGSPIPVGRNPPPFPGCAGVVPRSAALHEIYLQPVEDAVRAGAAGVLCSPATGPTGAAAAGTAGGASTPGGAGSTGTAGSASTVPTGPAAGPAGSRPAYTPGAARKHTGLPPCGNPGLLIQVLRSELGFTGFVLAGPGANPGTLSLDSGLDGEIPAAGRSAARY